ncbi:hypothetical protein SAICODRAFT_28336 [Saitoella complicata NRRL Y-17804]|nr:uncharacterized protein SAICODRAFT_28336 [Saitoella complicata NRRL Y-17804]ODQ56022.1 hypothetical protein SAICODRAFT_28336 [Saitoella complicata NRRL Y-17804]
MRPTIQSRDSAVSAVALDRDLNELEGDVLEDSASSRDSVLDISPALLFPRTSPPCAPAGCLWPSEEVSPGEKPGPQMFGIRRISSAVFPSHRSPRWHSYTRRRSLRPLGVLPKASPPCGIEQWLDQQELCMPSALERYEPILEDEQPEPVVEHQRPPSPDPSEMDYCVVDDAAYVGEGGNGQRTYEGELRHTTRLPLGEFGKMIFSLASHLVQM